MSEPSYRPETAPLLAFAPLRAAFRDGSDSPRAFLERCIETIEAREPTVRAFTAMNLEGARAAADAADKRYAEGRPLSPVDGLPLGVKDLYETKDMPTGMGSPIYEGWESKRDAACVRHLRAAGGVIVGKTVTTEFGFYTPGPTTNPFDPICSPGGSSSGSAAAVGAGMLPAAIGSQVVGSIVRPASFCGNVGFKPSFGALNRSGGHSSLSQSHLGSHAGSLADAWLLAHTISSRAGGDPGHPGLYGPAELPAAVKPARLARLETAGWESLDDASKAAFEDLVARLLKLGVEIVGRKEDQSLEAFETAIARALAITHVVCGWELRWPLAEYAESHPGKLSADIEKRLEGWLQLSIEDYRLALAEREEVRRRLAALAPSYDGLLTLSSHGPAPKTLANTGNPAFNPQASMTGAPTFSLPLMAVGGMPLGAQLMGFLHQDARLAAVARWIMESLQPHTAA